MHKLRVFVAIVDAGSMTKAARAIGISRSAVSAHLKQLETDLGVRLLDRTTRTMNITSVGEQIYISGREMIRAAQRAIDAADDHLGAVRGMLRLAVPVDLSTQVLGPVVTSLRRTHPELQVEVMVGDSPVDILRDGVDVAIRMGVALDSSLVMRRLARTQEIVVASPTLVQPDADIDEWSALPRIAHSVVEQLQDTLVHPNGEHHSWRTAPAISIGSTDLMRYFATQGLGVAVVPELIVREELDTGNLIRVGAPWYRRKVNVYALLPSPVTSPAVRALLNALTTHCAHLDRTPQMTPQ